MRYLGVVLTVLTIAACASGGPTEKSAGGPAMAPAKASAQTSSSSTSDEAAAVETSDQSQVLSTKKKCPRNSKLVNGKCTLQVESDDE